MAVPRKVYWGVLGTAKIAREKVIPAMQQGDRCEIVAIASRELEKALRVAEALGVPRHYGSYQELLEDPEIEAVYIPLPNHLHLPWTRRAAEAGKHILCEKPLALSAAEAAEILRIQKKTGVLIQEAFMIKTHPQWQQAIDWIHQGRLGQLKAMHCNFSYENPDPENIRNVPEFGGGGLMDIGCYAVFAARWAFQSEPTRVFSVLEFDPEMHVDRLASAILEFPTGHATFTVGTQMLLSQSVTFVGTRGGLQIEIPFNAPPDRPCRIFWTDQAALGSWEKEIQVESCDQFTIQGDRFSTAVLGEREPAVPLEFSVQNMAVIEAIQQASGPSGPPLTGLHR